MNIACGILINIAVYVAQDESVGILKALVT
jgi:hypothetical protein